MPRNLLFTLLFVIAPRVLLAQEAAEGASGSELLEATTGDGITLQADLYAAADASAPVVILMHEHRKDRATFQPLVPALREAGFNVVNLDLRGHGGSTRKSDGVIDASAVPMSMTRSLLIQSQKDVFAVLGALEERGVQTGRFAMVGAGYGASAAWVASPFWRRELHALVLLSPATGAFAIDVMPYVETFPGQLLLITDFRDPTAAHSTVKIQDAHPGGDERIALKQVGRGTNILVSYPDINEKIASFLKVAFETPPRALEPALAPEAEESP